MNRRKFLGTGIGVVGGLVAFAALGAGKPKGDRILTRDGPERPWIALYKNGQQIGMVYWANLDTKEYRRSALMADFWPDAPLYPGDRLVRHVEGRVISQTIGGNRYEYAISHLPLVSYDPHPNNLYVSVENTFDEVKMSPEAPEWFRLQYPDIPLREPVAKPPISESGISYVYAYSVEKSWTDPGKRIQVL